jgi:phenylacetate-CoA ligase
MGETGKVIVTPLHNFAMPLLRYDLEDYAEVGEPCGCGRGLPVLNRIAGRVRNMLTLPSGEKRWPQLGLLYWQIAPIRRRQVVQRSLEQVELHLVVDRRLTHEEEEKARRHLIENLGHPFDVSIVYRDNLSRPAGGKFEEFRSELNA